MGIGVFKNSIATYTDGGRFEAFKADLAVLCVKHRVSLEVDFLEGVLEVLPEKEPGKGLNDVRIVNAITAENEAWAHANPVL